MTPSFLSTEDELRRHVPEPNSLTLKKIVPRLEPSARAWIDDARLVALALRRGDGRVHVLARSSPAGVAHAPDEHRVVVGDQPDLAVATLPSPLSAATPAASIFIVPGENSTLRANGTADVQKDELTLHVDAAYMHCPKAFVRSALWRTTGAAAAGFEPVAERHAPLGPSSRAFIQHSPFALLGTCGPDGGADLSPRGDPPGFVRVVDDRTLLLPDRPGNRIVDSFRNVLGDPQIGLLFMIPGLDWILRICARARLTADPAWLADLAVRGKPPQLGLWLEVDEADLQPAPALAAAGIWSGEAGPRTAPTVGRAIVEQVEPQGRFRALKGWLLDRALRRDARRNLY